MDRSESMSPRRALMEAVRWARVGGLLRGRGRGVTLCAAEGARPKCGVGFYKGELSNLIGNTIDLNAVMGPFTFTVVLSMTGEFEGVIGGFGPGAFPAGASVAFDHTSLPLGPRPD
jgi:hypothetical protein